MAIITRKIVTYLKNIKDLSDTPNKDGMTADDLKAFFDGRGDAEIKASINGIVDDLVSATDGSSGADQIGATVLKVGGAVTVQTQLEELKIDKLETSVLETHKASTDHDSHIATLHYTKANMQTSGGSQVNWDNLTNKPNLADSSWKPSVATPANLPAANNTLGDQRTVLNDGDGKQAVYSCVATSGDWDAQWDKIADVDWMAGEAAREAAESSRVTVEGDRVTAEGLRVTAEGIRVGSENTRIANETARGSAEGLRVTAESNRATIEENRVTAENLRASTEAARQYIGVYAGATAYSVGNQVTYNGSTYRCILASTGNLPTNATYWILIALKGTDGTSVTVEDVLTSTSTVNALSSKQGKNLKDTADTLANIVSTVSGNMNAIALNLQRELLYIKLAQVGLNLGVNAWSDSLEDTLGINSSLSNNYNFSASKKSISVAISSSDSCVSGTSISGGDASTYTSSKAFDNNGVATYWGSSQSASGVSGVAYIGYHFASSIILKKITCSQYSDTDHTIASAKVQYSSNGTAWTTVDTISLARSTSAIQSFDISNSISAPYWRLLANANPDNFNWIVYEIEMFALASGNATIIWNSISSEGTLSRAVVESIQTGSITYYISRNGGTTYTQCTLDTATDISTQPSGTNIILKAVITGADELMAVAWGGQI